MGRTVYRTELLVALIACLVLCGVCACLLGFSRQATMNCAR